MSQVPGDRQMKLGEILLQAGLIDKLQLNTALKYQREWDRKLGEALVELGFISENILVKVLSKFLQVPSVELSQVRIHPLALQKVPRRLAEKYGLMPIDLEGEGPKATLMVAMIDPTNLVAIDEVAFTSGCKVRPVVATHTDIDKAIRRHYGDDRVVDVFFDGMQPQSSSPMPSSSPSQNTPPGIPRNLDPMSLRESGSGDDMVILRRGEETRLRMPSSSSSSTVSPPPPPPAAPARPPQGLPKPMFTHAPLPAQAVSITSPDVLVAALVRLLIKKGLMTEGELEQEVTVHSPKL